MGKLKASLLAMAFFIFVTAATLFSFAVVSSDDRTAAEETLTVSASASAARAVATHNHNASKWKEYTGGNLTGPNTDTDNDAHWYYLTKNLTGVKITIKGNVILCLNSHYLTGSAAGSVITVGQNARFTLCDCQHDTSPGRIRQGTSDLGGGVHINEGGTFIMKGGTIRANKAVRGGGVYVGSGGTFRFLYGRIRKNNAASGTVNGDSANGNGAGVYIATGGKFYMEDGEIFQNTAEFSGGGVYIANNGSGNYGSGAFEMSGGVISNNIAGNGAGVSLNKGTFKMTGGTIGGTELGQYPMNDKDETEAAVQGGNTATVRGGGIFNAGGAVTISGSSAIKFNNNNAATTDELSGGGGIHVIQTSDGIKGTVTVTGGTIESNSSWRGGGVFVGRNGEFEASGGGISNNSSTGNGGGVYAQGGTVKISGTVEISKNTVASNGSGGGVFVEGFPDTAAGGKMIADGGVIMSGGSIKEHTAYSGGGVHIGVSGNFTLSGGEISDNTAADVGGGAYVYGGGLLTVSGGYISGNKALGGSGGGVCVASYGKDEAKVAGEFVMENGEISDNTAKAGAGVASLGAVTVKNGKIAGNTAEGGGGGVLVQGATLTISGGAISGNAAQTGGGLYVWDAGSKLDMSAGTVSGNTATQQGGGAYVSAAFTMTGGTIGGLTDGDRNSAATGGGVYVVSLASFDLNGGAIAGNIASSNGGGVYVDGEFKIQSGTVSGNKAANGGGVYVYGAMSVSGGVITDNKKSSDGVTNSNVYLVNGKTMTVIGALKSDARIGVTVPSGVIAYAFTDGYGANNAISGVINKPSKYFFADTGTCLWLNAAGEAAVGHNITDQKDYKKATCFEDGTYAYWYCDECKKRFGNAECTSVLTIDPVIPAGHVTAAVPAVPATCLTAGNIAHAKCNVCQTHFKDTVDLTAIGEDVYVIAALGHNFAVDLDESKAATCVESGVRALYCTRDNCGTTKTETVAPIAHDGKAEAREDANCTTSGRYAYFLCQKGCNLYWYDADGDGKYESSGSKLSDAVMPATGHDYGSPIAPVWSWSDDFTKATAKFVCNTCGKDHTEEAKVGDDPLIKPQTCTQNGSVTYTATVTYTGYGTFTDAAIERLVAPGHSWVANWSDWQSDGEGGYTISVTFSCNATAPHSEDGTDITIARTSSVAATCVADGEDVWSASVRFNETTYNAPPHKVVIRATGVHSYNIEKTIDRAPTCTEVGSKSVHCSVCGASKEGTEESVPALGHKWAITVNDGAHREYTAFEPFRLAGINVTFTCDNDENATHAYTFMGGTTAATVKHNSGDCLRIGDTSVKFTATIPTYGEYTHTVNGIVVSRRNAQNAVWEYSSDDSNWTELNKNASFEYDPNKTYAVRVSFDKYAADGTGRYEILIGDRFGAANTYTYTLAEYGDYSLADSSRSLTVNKKQIDAGGAKWISGGVELLNGYIVSDGGKYKYYSSSVADSRQVTNAAVRYASGTVTVAYPVPAGHGGIYRATYGDSTVTANASGKYTAVATLTLVDADNYYFAAADGATLNADGTVTVEKEWYAAICDNGFTGIIAGWTFGTSASPLPELEHDDGRDETVMLTLYRNGAAIRTFDRGAYGNYINGNMPVGDYTLIATVGTVDDGGVSYEGFSNYTFTFTVGAATLAITNESALKATVNATYDGKLHINDTAPIASALVSDGTGYWLGSDLYASGLTVMFGTSQNGAFVSANELKKNAAKAFINAGGYTAYFKISALNYADVIGSFRVEIEKAAYDLKDVKFEDKTVTYDKSATWSIEITGVPNGVKATFENNGHTNANESGYSVTATLTFDDAVNYKFVNSAVQNDPHIKNDGKLAEYSATLIVKKAVYDFTAHFADDELFYDGNPHSIYIAVDGGELPEGVSVTYEGNGRTVSGKHTVTAKFKGDYDNYVAIENMTATLWIKKVAVGLDLRFDSAEFDYDGEPHRIELVGLTEDLLKLVDVAYTDRSGVNNGMYNATATVTLKDPVNYEFAPDTKTFYKATLTITEKKLDMSGVSFNNKTVTYTGNAFSLSISGVLPQGVSYSYENNGQTEVGEHTVTVHFYGPPNYGQIEDMTAKLIIEKAVYDINVAFPNATVAYTGNPHSLSLRGVLPAGVTYEYLNNSRTVVGSQTVTVRFTGDTKNYAPIPDVTATLTVVPASFGVTNVSLESKILAYDGNTHSLAVEGALPTGVTVKYYAIVDGKEVEFDGATAAGTYDVVAKFVLSDSENYKAMRPLNAKLTITAPEKPVESPIIKPSADEVEAPVSVVGNDDKQATPVLGEVSEIKDFPYWIVAVCVIGAEVIAMAVMGCYIAFGAYKRKKRK
ncbi:MAG: hypothetical protein NC184_03185 [Roseburia sp.]|nr:hypothetical protein [Roseburia sp.]